MKQFFTEKQINLKSNSNILNIILQTKKVLNNAIRLGGSSIKNFKKINGISGSFQKTFKVYGKNDKKCPRQNCIGYIKKIVNSKRSAFYCPICQL